MKYMIIKDYYTGKESRRKLNEKCQGQSLSYEVEDAPRSPKRYLVVRSYYSNEILQKIDVTRSGSIEFFVRNIDRWEEQV